VGIELHPGGFNTGQRVCSPWEAQPRTPLLRPHFREVNVCTSALTCCSSRIYRFFFLISDIRVSAASAASLAAHSASSAACFALSVASLVSSTLRSISPNRSFTSLTCSSIPLAAASSLSVNSSVSISSTRDLISVGETKTFLPSSRFL
jgi:hypothetical protein